MGLLFPNKSENIEDVDEAIPLISLLNEEKKSLPPVWVTSALSECCIGAKDCFDPWLLSVFIRPFFVAASLAVLVKSPIVDLLTYVKSSNVFLLASAACFEACIACLDASSAAFFACIVNWKKVNELFGEFSKILSNKSNYF